MSASSSSSSSALLTRSSGSSTPAKKAPFRPASAHPSSSSTASSPSSSHITPPKTRIPTFTRSPASASSSSPPSPPSSTSATAAAGSMPSPHSGPAIMRNAPAALAKKNLSSSPAVNSRLSGEINAARSYLASESSLSSASAMVSQADRRNRLKKRLLIAQTEKIKELLWEKASLLQKRQLMEDEQRETEQLKAKIEEEREERQRQWVMEEAQRREEEEEELKFSLMRLRKFSQRYDFEMAKRERMIRSKEQKDKKKSSFAADMQAEGRRREAERSRVIEGIREQLDDTLQPANAALVTAAATAATSSRSSAPHAAAAPAPAPLALAGQPSSPPGVISPVSPASSNSSVLPAFIARRTSEGGQSTTSTISESEVARELRAGGFPAGADKSTDSVAAPAAAPVGGAAAGAKAAGSADNSAGDDLLDFREDGIAHADGLLDDDDVLFLSSTDSSDEEEEKEVSQSGSRRSSVNASKAAKKASAKAAREEKEQEREREEMEKRQQETAKEREEREKREEEERQRKEKEWEELKERLLSETRQLQETERLRLQREREEENKRAALQLAAREAEMNELIAKLKEQEGKGAALPVQPPAPATESAPAAAAAAAVATPALPETSEPPRAATSPPQPVSTTPTQSLPPLSSISLRSATVSVSRKLKSEDEIDEPKQAPGALNPLPSLSSTPVRRLVSPAASSAAAAPASAGRGRKPEQSESMAISSMLHELEALEEEEEMMLKMGLDVTKLPRSGKPKVVRMFIDRGEQDEWLLRWDSKKKSKEQASIPLSQCRVVTGIGQGLFLKPDFAAMFAARRNCCFSVIAPDRTLDVCTTTHSDQDVWTRTLSRLAKARKRGGAGTAGGSAAISEANSRLVSPVGSAPASRRASGTAAGFVSVGTERSKSGKVGGSSGLSDGDPNKDIENYLSRHLKNF